MSRTFNGSSQYAAAAANTIYNSTDITISAWVKMDASAGGVDSLVAIGGQLAAAVIDGPSLEVNTFNGIQANVWDSGAFTTQIGSSFVYSNATWYNVVTTQRLTTSELNRFFVDGSQQGADLTSGGRTASSEPLQIAVNNDQTGSHLFGEVAEVSIYNTDLTGTQITNLSNGDSPLSASLVGDCVAYWRMDGSASTEADLVSGITLTYTGSPGTGTPPAVDDPPVASSGFPVIDRIIKAAAG